MKSHKGEIIEFITRKSGYSLKQVAIRMGISRSTLYSRFEAMDVSDDFILKLGQVIHYNFSKEFPNLKEKTEVKRAEESFAIHQGKNHKTFLVLEKRYYQLLETHSKLLELAVKIARAKDHDLPKLQKEVMHFIEQNTN